MNAYVFPGQGAQYVGMGKDLYDAHPRFRYWLDQCADLLEPHLERPCVDPIAPPPVLFGRCARAGLAQGVETFHQHQPADNAEKGDVAKRDQQVDLPHLAQGLEDLHADDRPCGAARREHRVRQVGHN